MLKRFAALAAPALFCALVGIVLPVAADWSRVQLPGGAQVCQDSATGAQFKPPYTLKADVTKACNTLTAFLPWLSTADAANVVRALVVTPSNTYDESCPTGNCAPTTVAWNTSALATAMLVVVSQQTGTATDIDLSAYCSGANCASATYALHTAVAHWSIGGTGTKHLLNAGSNTGSSPVDGALVLDVCYMAACASSTAFSWAYTSPAPSDTTAPNPVTGLTSPSVGTNVVNLTFNSTQDQGGSLARSGIASYKYYRDGTLLATDSAASSGLSTSWVGGLIGSPTGITPSCTQSGVAWTVAGGGPVEPDSTSDNFYACKATISGTKAQIIVKLGAAGITSSANYPKLILELASADTPTAIANNLTLMHQNVAPVGWYLQSYSRNGSGAPRTDSFSGNGGISVFLGTTMPACVELLYDSSVGATGAHSADCTTFTNDFSNYSAAPLPTTMFARVGASATNDGTNDGQAATVALDWITLSGDGTISKALTTTSAGTFTVKAADVAGNISTALPGLFLTPGSTSTNNVKFHQGLYSQTGNVPMGSGQSSAIVSTIQANCSNSAIAGFQIEPGWTYFEGATLGNYTAGFADTDAILSAAQACGKHVMFNIALKVFGNPYTTQPSTNAVFVVPAYMVTSTYGNCCSGQVNSYWTMGGAILSAVQNGEQQDAALWSSVVADRLIALVNAYGARYDGNASFEMLSIGGETAYNGGTYNENAYMTQLGRVLDAAATAFPHTAIRLPLNFLGSSANMESLISKCASEPNCILGGPDPLAAAHEVQLIGKKDDWTASQIYIGQGSSGHDWRGQVSWLIETQCDMIQPGCSGHMMMCDTAVAGHACDDSTDGRVTPQACNETVAAIRNYTENSGANTPPAIGTGADMRPKYYIFSDWVDCYQPSSPNAGVIQSFTTTPKPGSQTCPPNYPGCTIN